MKLGTRHVASKGCRFCGRTWEELKLKKDAKRQVCWAPECRDKLEEEQKAKRRKATADDLSQEEYHAGRTQGIFRVPAIERGQSKKVTESFVCWCCGTPHEPKEIIKTLGLTCACGAVFFFTIGVRETKSYIVRVDRHR